MKIFITGGSGMVGRNILEHPKTEEHEIIAPARKDLDLLDRPSILNSLVNFKPDFVIHCAGRVGGIQANMANPVAFLRDNTDIGLNVIEASLKAGVTNFINLGSSCIYPRDAKIPIVEESLLTDVLEKTNEPYAIAKIAAIKLCESYYQQYNNNFYSIMPCNMYGPRDNFDLKSSHVLPALIRKVDQAKESGA